MKKCDLTDIYELADIIYDQAADGNWVYATLFYDDATELMRALLDYEDVSVQCIDIADDTIDGYNKEYHVALDPNLSLAVEHAWQDKNEWNEAGYLYFEADVLYIDGSANYAVVKRQGNPECDVYELEIEDSIEFDDESDESDFCSLLDFLLDVIEGAISEDDSEYDEDKNDEVLEFIHRRFPWELIWDYENCYYFALILKDRFPGGEIFYDVINGHFSYKYKGKHYDHTGVINPDGYLVNWEKFDDYDSIQKKRIIRDCIK